MSAGAARHERPGQGRRGGPTGPPAADAAAPAGDGAGELDAALAQVAAVADAVLFEGYLLYPYRASAQKNRLRWQFGVLTPAADACEPTGNRTECLLEPGPSGELHVRLRFLALRSRTLLSADGAQVPELDVDGHRHLSFEEGLPCQVDAVLAVEDLLRGGCTVPVRFPASRQVEPLRDAAGRPAGTLVRRGWPVTGRLVVSASELPGPYLVHRLRLDVLNDGDCRAGAPRDEVLRTSLIAAHTLLAARSGRFVSLTDPPRWARDAAAGCVNEHTWPVLAGPPERGDLLLSAPIILADHPRLAPESTVAMFDGLENDEILTLRTLVLTDREKAEARATDPRAAELIDAVEAMPPQVMERLHGAIRSLRRLGDPAAGTAGVAAPRGPAVGMPASWAPTIGADDPSQLPGPVPWWDPAADAAVHPETDAALVGGAEVARGSRVVLRPGRGGDVQDRFLAGMSATVAAVVHDVDGGVHVAVTVDGDPAAELQLAHGRLRYFRPDELELPP